LNSKSNLNLIKSAGYGYIVASKIKSMKEAVLTQIFDNTGYIDTNEFRYKTLEYVNEFTDEEKVKHQLSENLIVSYSEKRAGKDLADRERLIEKAEKMLRNPSSIKSSNKRGGRKFLEAESETVYHLDKTAIEKDSRFDGYYGIQTSEKSMTGEEIIGAYHMLWKIEESFRIMKSSLEVRPVFHWKKERIHGHFVLCFLSFMLERRLETLLNEAGVENSPEKIKDALNEMQLAKVELNGEETYIKAKNRPLANHICKILGIKQPQNISNAEQIKEMLRVPGKLSWGQLSLF